MDERERQLFFLHVEPRRFAGNALPARIIEQIVADLKYHPDIFAEFLQSTKDFFVVRHSGSADLAARREQRSGLVGYDLQIRRLVDIEVPALGNLENLRLAHPPDRVRCDFQELEVVVIEGEE